MPTARFSLIQNPVTVASVDEMVDHVRSFPDGPVPSVAGPALGARRRGGDVKILSYAPVAGGWIAGVLLRVAWSPRRGRT